MKKAYLLIDVDDKGKANQIAELLRQKPSVVLADAVTGPHDVIAVLEGWDTGEYNLQTLACIRKVEGVRYVTACFTVRIESSNGCELDRHRPIEIHSNEERGIS